ncbi:MAG: PRC-barrel domain-containing protein [Thermomicrobiales bacterium]
MDRMYIKDLKGLTVVSIAEGDKVGLINRIYLDPQSRKIGGLSVEPGGSLLEPDSRKLIDIDDIHSLGPDALTLADKDAVCGDQTNERWMELVDLDDVVKEKVVTEGGEYVGQVTTIQFESSTWSLTGVEVSPGFFRDNKMIGNEDVTTIGPELVIVSDSVCADTSEPAVTDEPDSQPRWVVEETATAERPQA